MMGTSWVGATFQLGGCGLPSISLASNWLRRSPVTRDITYLPHMGSLCPTSSSREGKPVCGKTRRTAFGRSANQLLRSCGIECRQADTTSGKGAHTTADQHHQPNVSSAKAPPSWGFPMCRETRGRGGYQRPPDHGSWQPLSSQLPSADSSGRPECSQPLGLHARPCLWRPATEQHRLTHKDPHRTPARQE